MQPQQRNLLSIFYRGAGAGGAGAVVGGRLGGRRSQRYLEKQHSQSASQPQTLPHSLSQPQQPSVSISIGIDVGAGASAGGAGAGVGDRVGPFSTPSLDVSDEYDAPSPPREIVIVIEGDSAHARRAAGDPVPVDFNEEHQPLHREPQGPAHRQQQRL
jgi:hypothetical protein